MAKTTLPHPSVPLVDPQTGFMSQDWYNYFFDRERVGIAGLPDVSPTAPTNGQVLLYNSTTRLWTPGAN